MPADLREMAAVLSGGGGLQPVERETVENAIQALLHHQVVYDDTPGIARSALDAIRRHRSFFDAYFSAAGFNLRIEAREGMIALEPRGRVYGWRQNRLRKDETLVRLALRLAYDDGLRLGVVDGAGRVEASVGDLAEMFRSLAGAEPPTEARLREIIVEMQRRGGVRLSREGEAEALAIMPGIRVHVPDTYIAAVSEWVAAGCPGGDVFARPAAAPDASDDDASI